MTTARDELVRVTVSGGGQRVDLALPAAVPVAELVPELATALGLLAPDTVRGHRLVTTDGHGLVDDLGLAAQGIGDGAVLTVVDVADAVVPRRHDDVAEAVGEVVEDSVAPWSPAAARRTTLGAATAVLAVGLGSLAAGPAQLSAAVAALLGLALCGVAVVADRLRGDAGTAAVAAWVGVGHGAVAGAVLAPAGFPPAGIPLATGGAGAAVAALGCLAALGAARGVVVAPAILAGVAVAIGVTIGFAGVAPSIVLPVALVVMVLVGNVLPRVALAASGVHADLRVTTGAAVDALRADVLSAHAVVLAGEVATGVLLVVVAPVAVREGVAGASLVVASALVVTLRVRHRRSGAQVQVATVASSAALVVAAVAALLAHPGWQPVLAVALPVVGLAALLAVLVPGLPVVRLRRWGDLLELCGVVALLPLLVLAVGLFDAVRA